MKYVVVLLVIGVVLWLALRARAARVRSVRRSRPQPMRPMVRCAHCGVHLPQDEALPAERLFFCSEAHRALGPQRG